MNNDELNPAVRPRLPAAIAWIAPLALYLIFGLVEPWFHSPTVPEPSRVVSVQELEQTPAPSTSPGFGNGGYAIFTTVKLLIVGGCVIFFLPHYLRTFHWHVDRWAVVVGLVGAMIWIGLCGLSLEAKIATALGFDVAWLSGRSHFDPFQEFSSPLSKTLFLLSRLGLLVVVVPIAEEAFVRGFLMRFVQSENWQAVRLTQIGWRGLVCGTLYGVLAHPQEAVAAAVWFSLISALMVGTGKFWNCVGAHAVTNCVLGAYILAAGQWQLW